MILLYNYRTSMEKIKVQPHVFINQTIQLKFELFLQVIKYHFLSIFKFYIYHTQLTVLFL